MTPEELQALMERDERDIVDILTTTMKQVPDFDTLAATLMQLQMLYAIGYCISANVVNVVTEWGLEVESEEPEEKYDA